MKQDGDLHGWYNATVQSYDEESDILSVVYNVEPGCIYTMEVDDAIASNALKLLKSVI